MRREFIKSHKDLGVYQMAFDAAMRSFELSKKFPMEERYSLTDQIRRSSRSVCANMAEVSFIDPLREGIELLAIPTNPSVVRTLKKFEFQSEPGETLDGYPLYKRSFALKKAADWISYASFS